MTSQKRYRHHENNATSRFRDIPPRFKRQKSSSSPTPKTTETVENQEHQSVEQSPVTSCPPTSINSTMAPLPSNNVGNSASPPLNDLRQGGSPDSFTQARNYYAYDHEIPPMGMCSAQLPSPAGLRSPSTLYTWNSQQLSPHPAAVNHRVYSPHQPLMPHQENISPSLELAMVRNDEAHGPLAGAPSPTSVDYSDPDIRTIEMLRELERVADEKEKEDENDPTVDRKNLVSHHLRMLMCAVDRYTEGVEENDAVGSENIPIGNGQGSAHKDLRHKTDAFPSTPQPNSKRSPNKGLPASQQKPPHHMQQAAWTGHGSEDGAGWQQVVPNRNRKQSRQQLPSPAPNARLTPPMSSPPPPSATMNPPSMSPTHGCYTPPYSHQQTPVRPPTYPMRAITKYDNGQVHNRPSPWLNPQGYLSPCLGDSCSPPFSPASSPSLQIKEMWGPLNLDSPTETDKSWDLWSGPSFHANVYRGQANLPSDRSNTLIPFVNYPPPTEHLPLYSRR